VDKAKDAAQKAKSAKEASEKDEGSATSFDPWSDAAMKGKTQFTTFAHNDDDDGDDDCEIATEDDFKTLGDESTAFILKPGYRVKLKLSDLLDGGDDAKEEREKRDAKLKKTNEMWSYGGPMPLWQPPKQHVNEYTVTMDLMLLESPPREGIALFQTSLVHKHEGITDHQVLFLTTPVPRK